MSDKYKIGVDIKFLQNAAVVMMCEPSVYPDREELLQMVGRGTAQVGTTSGWSLPTTRRVAKKTSKS
jgi:hypothetical protein